MANDLFFPYFLYLQNVCPLSWCLPDKVMAWKKSSALDSIFVVKNHHAHTTTPQEREQKSVNEVWIVHWTV